MNAATEKAVTLAINNLDEIAPTITSGTTAVAINENVGAGQVVYTAVATDSADISAGVTYSLKAVGDASAFTINASTGAVTLTGNPNYETKSSYSFTVLASDGVNAATEKAVTLAINNVNEAPVITSAANASFAENATGTAYTATASDPDAGAILTYSLGGTDAALFNIDSVTGVVTFKVSPNYEAPSDAGANNVYDITVTANDGNLSSTTQAVGITVTNVNEAPVAVADSVFTNSATTSNLPGWALTANDSDVDSSSLSVTTAINNSGLTSVSATAGVITASSIVTGDSLTYTVSDGALTSQANATFTVQATNLTGTAGNEVLINATTSARTLSGLGGDDILIGNTGADTLTGGAGADVMYGGAGKDAFVFASGDSGQATGFDVIKDYHIAAAGTGDLINYSTASMSVTGMSATATSSMASISSTTGVATFAAGSGTTLADALSDIAAATGTTAGKMALFQVSGNGDYYLYISDATLGVGAGDVVVQLQGVTAVSTINIVTTTGSTKGLTITAGTSVAPIALDLNRDGIEYLNRQANVVYDYSNNNLLLSTAWVNPEDGLLAIQKGDGSLSITFSTETGETDLQGLAKVYDTNHDNVFDAKDAGFNNFGVWQDANSDGIVQEGEFRTLADRGIASLSLTSDGVIHTAAGGDVTIFGQTTYTMTDGSTGIAEDVAFAVSPVVADGNGVQDVYHIASVADAAVVIDNFSINDGDRVDLSSILHPADSVHSMISMDQHGLVDSHSTITVNIGGVDYEVATLYGKEIGVPDALGAHAGGSSLSDALHGASWTDVVDVSSDHGGPASISAAGGALTNSYSNEAGDWTVQIKSGTATVDAANKQINFTSDHAGNEAIITTADGTAHEISNVDKILWH